ncbi:MAG: ABC transporter permease [Burkholderiaceae bacterium]|jgi:putative ABC transport system permease protein|nr:ABC transporter permease [Burkholderiaceae bacterium]
MAEAAADRHGPTFEQSLIEALGSLRLLGRRSVLALVGIAVGCAAIVALLNIGHNTANESLGEFKGLGVNTLLASFQAEFGDKAPPPAPATLDAKALIAAVPGVERVVPLGSPYSTRARYAGKAVDATVVGTTADLSPVLGLRLTAGRFLSDYDQKAVYAVVGAGIAKALALRLGNSIQIDDYLFEVVGIAAKQDRNFLIPVEPNDAIYIPITGMRRLVPVPEIETIVARTLDTARLEEKAEALKAYLQTVSRGRTVEVQIPKQMLDSLARQTRTFSYLLAGLGGISLLVGGVGVMNVMLMSVSERRREIGVRMALGARARDIRNLFLFEGAILSVAGAILGAVVGLIAAYLFVRISGWPFELSLFSLPLGILSSLMVGLFFGLHPALTAARLQPAQALRDE